MLPHLKVQVVNTKCANPTWPKIDGSCLPNNLVEIETVVDTTKLEGNESAKRFRGQNIVVSKTTNDKGRSCVQNVRFRF